MPRPGRVLQAGGLLRDLTVREPVAAVAAALHPATGTVRNQLSNANAINATGAANRIEGAYLAHEQGWIQARSHACGKQAHGCPL